MAAAKPQSIQDPDPLWYKDAIVYQLHVKAFRDSNDDGVGDFPGLTEKLDYVADLGVNTIWLLPFYPSPMRDDGYDIADYSGIYAPYGTRSDFRRFVREAHRRGIRVITELVINHTSDQHPWFQQARLAPRGSAKRDYYVWSDTDQKYAGTRIIFTDTETSNWAWDPVAQQYYWHRFFSHQPDLNFANPNVVNSLIRVMRSWLDMGVDGLRLDAIPYLCEREGTSNENLSETHTVVKRMRAALDARYAGRMFLAEANQWPEDVLEYFGDGDECHMAYHFPLMPRMYMAMAQQDRHPIVEILQQTPAIPEICQWAIFLRNHDELTLEMVTDEERDYMYEAYARDPRARINVGIRRRLAPLMDNDIDAIKLLKSVLLSMPGSPILYYGVEIGMGDNIFLGDRNGVRTPMQWSPDRNAGFSRADPQQLYLPPIMDPIYGYEAVNVEAQSRDVSSLLNWTRRVIAVRKSSRALGRGSLTLLKPGNRHVLAYLREHDGETILCVANLARTAQPVELDLSRFRGRVPVDMMGRTPFPPVGELPYLLTLAGRGFFWFRLTSEAEVPEWHVEALPRADLATLVVSDGWDVFFPERLPRERRGVAVSTLARFTDTVLPSFLAASRWFAAKSATVTGVELARSLLWETAAGTYLLLWARVRLAEGSEQTYFLPLAIAWGPDQLPAIRELLPAALARVRDRARVGVLYEAIRDPQFCRMLVAALGRGGNVELESALLQFTPTSAAPGILAKLDADAELRVPPGETSNTIAFLGTTIFLKLYRRDITDGPAPELEITRFLTERTDFRAFPRLVGAVELLDAAGTTLVALAQEFKRSQGDGWRYVTTYLERFLDETQLRPAEETRQALDRIHAENEVLLETLGRRTGELHLALTARSGDAAFEPEPVSGTDLDAWTATVRRDAESALARLAAARDTLPADARADAEELLARRGRLLDRIDRRRIAGFRGIKGRYHGDYHLGQVLIAENDFVITDFEGEPTRPVSERRRKHSALRDVAGMLRSLDYATRAAIRKVSDVELGDPAVFHGFALEWQDRASRAFLGGYAQVTDGHALHGPAFEHALPVIDLFVIEKALYELCYELDNRPDWVHLPIGGLLRRLESAPEVPGRSAK